MTDQAPKKGPGRPPKKVRRPTPHPEFKGMGALTQEAWGYIRRYVEDRIEKQSWRDIAAYFDMPVSTLRSHMARPHGETTVARDAKRGRSESNEATMTERQSKIRDLIKEEPMIRTRDIASKLKVSKSTVHADLEEMGLRDKK